MADAPQQVVSALNEALVGEYSAIYAYGLIGAQLTGSARNRAVRALLAHQTGRDQLRRQLVALGQTPPPPASAYRPPTPVTSSAIASALAISVEQHQTQLWSLVASVSGGDDRRAAARSAQECAVRAITWGAPTQAFVGA